MFYKFWLWLNPNIPNKRNNKKGQWQIVMSFISHPVNQWVGELDCLAIIQMERPILQKNIHRVCLSRNREVSEKMI